MLMPKKVKLTESRCAAAQRQGRVRGGDLAFGEYV